MSDLTEIVIVLTLFLLIFLIVYMKMTRKTLKDSILELKEALTPVKPEVLGG